MQKKFRPAGLKLENFPALRGYNRKRFFDPAVLKVQKRIALRGPNCFFSALRGKKYVVRDLECNLQWGCSDFAFHVAGSRLHRGTCNVELATWNLQRGTCNVELQLGSCNVELQLGCCNVELQRGTCNLESATWNLKCGLCSNSMTWNSVK